jgi:hypothetical protein
VDGGELFTLDALGRRQRMFAFDDQVRLQGPTYGPPWVITGFALSPGPGPAQIAVISHHYMWSPGLVTVLDADWKRRGTYVNAGWIETLGWTAPNRLVVGGFAGSLDGGMVALLDPATMNGQSPEPEGSTVRCDGCGVAHPLRVVVLPRSELNLVTASRFNRANVEVIGGRVVARTVEYQPADTTGAVDAIYEFTPSLDLIRASFSDRYWELHRALEIEGKVHHTRAECPDRDGPREIIVWEPSSGWRRVAVSAP